MVISHGYFHITCWPKLLIIHLLWLDTHPVIAFPLQRPIFCHLGFVFETTFYRSSSLRSQTLRRSSLLIIVILGRISLKVNILLLFSRSAHWRRPEHVRPALRFAFHKNKTFLFTDCQLLHPSWQSLVGGWDFPKRSADKNGWLYTGFAQQAEAGPGVPPPNLAIVWLNFHSSTNKASFFMLRLRAVEKAKLCSFHTFNIILTSHFKYQQAFRWQRVVQALSKLLCMYRVHCTGDFLMFNNDGRFGIQASMDFKSGEMYTISVSFQTPPTA